MNTDKPLSDNLIQGIREELFGIAENGGGHFFYSDIRKKLESLMDDGHSKQAKDITIEIMKSYTHRPALTWELKKLLTNEEIINFGTWHKTAKSNRPKMKCSKCDSTKIARIFYGFPEFSDKLEKQIDRGTIKLGGCCVTGNDTKYECITCGMQFYKKPNGKNLNWTGKVKVIIESAKSSILINGIKND